MMEPLKADLLKRCPFNARNNKNYNRRDFSDFTLPLVNFVCNGTETISFLGSKVWDKIPSKIKEKEPIEAFKRAIKNENQKIVHAGCTNII